jgi:hypothetical protein
MSYRHAQHVVNMVRSAAGSHPSSTGPLMPRSIAHMSLSGMRNPDPVGTRLGDCADYGTRYGPHPATAWEGGDDGVIH